jgi:hypothetical protein
MVPGNRRKTLERTRVAPQMAHSVQYFVTNETPARRCCSLSGTCIVPPRLLRRRLLCHGLPRRWMRCRCINVPNSRMNRTDWPCSHSTPSAVTFAVARVGAEPSQTRRDSQWWGFRQRPVYIQFQFHCAMPSRAGMKGALRTEGS